MSHLQVSERLDLCLSAGNLAWWEMYLPSGKVVCNENKVKMLGYSLNDFQDATYQSFMDLVHPDDYDMVMKAMNDHLKGKKPLYEVDYRIKTKSGDYKWFHDRGSIVHRDASSDSLIVKGVVFDISNLKSSEQELKEIKKHLEDLVEQRTVDLQNQVDQRKKAEEYLQSNKQYLRDIIDSASEMILSFDMFNRISTWNKTAEYITGYKTIEVLNRSVGKLQVFQHPEKVKEFIQTVCQNPKSVQENINIVTKDNSKKIIQMSGTKIKGDKNQCIGAMFIGHDITKDMELHGKLLDGCSYLIADKNNQSSLDLFINLVLLDHKGLFITRGSPSMVKSMLPQNKNLTTILLRSEPISQYTSISSLNSLHQEIKKFTNKHPHAIILLDGIHYLLTKFSFDVFLATLYKINDSIATNKAILLVRVDPSTIEPREFGIIENELQTLPNKKIEGIIINDELFQILKYIYSQNQQNATVSFKKITSKFSIAYMTAANKIKMLEEKGLVVTKKEGKYRTIYITNKGKTMLHKRQNA